MYQIDGPPKLTSIDDYVGKQRRKSRGAPRPVPPGSRTIHQDKIVTDRRGVPITVFEGASHALSEINRIKNEQNLDIQVAISSRTDEPSWAYQCMKWLVIQDGTPLHKCFNDNLIIQINRSTSKVSIEKQALLMKIWFSSIMNFGISKVLAI